MKKAFLCLLCLILLLCACGKKDSGADEGELKIYYAVSGRQQAEKGMLGTENFRPAGSAPVQEQLLSAMFSAPTDEGLLSPYPEGTQVLNCTVLSGNMNLQLSEEYGNLSGLQETIADYCIVFTLSQLEGVDSVSIYVENGDNKLSLSREDVLIRQD